MSSNRPNSLPLPHQPPMLLVRELLESSTSSVTCRAVVDADYPMAGAEEVSSLLAIELGAQAAALIRIEGEDQHPAPRIGYLVAVRHARFHDPALPVGKALRVAARVTGGAGPLRMFDIEITTEDAPERPLVDASISTFLTERTTG